MTNLALVQPFNLPQVHRRDARQNLRSFPPTSCISGIAALFVRGQPSDEMVSGSY